MSPPVMEKDPKRKLQAYPEIEHWERLDIISAMMCSQRCRLERPDALMSQLQNLIFWYIDYNPGPKAFDLDRYTINVAKIANIYFQSAAIPSPVTPQTELCLKRDDGRCLITGAKGATACHIFPFAANSTQTSLNALRKLETDIKLTTYGNQDLLVKDLQCSDQSWNLLSLDPALHKWWARGYFGLRFQDIKEVDPTEPGRDRSYAVTMQFQWLPRHFRSEKTNDDNEENRKEGWWNLDIKAEHYDIWRELWETSLRHNHVGRYEGFRDIYDDELAVAMIHPATSKRLQSGNEIRVVFSDRKDAGKMQAMLELQWICHQVSSMTGAAAYSWFNPVPRR
ncbi:hypothetical protein Sste5346_007081 [Sporothrix stenoceras]|uniref:HNH nuclease domain-containing protein n=1 Tax=Sporothrix stenoceras TaxID=5173 RepID=A0ABR3YVE2_9PEZI